MHCRKYSQQFRYFRLQLNVASPDQLWIEHGASPDSDLVPLSAPGRSRTSRGHFGSAAVGRLSAEGSNTVKGKPSTVDILLQGVRRESSLTYKGESKRDALSILLRYAARTRNGLVQYQAMEKTNKG